MTFSRTTAIAVALSSTAFALPALAQDTFQGPYVAVFAGGANTHDKSDDRLIFDTNGDGLFQETVVPAPGADAFAPGFCEGTARGATPEIGCKKDKRRFDYGIRAGWDGRPGDGQFLAGMLIEYQRGSARDATSAFSTTPASYVITRKFKDAVNFRGRLGYVLNDTALLYATGGASYARIKNSFMTTNTVNSFTEFDDGDRVWGWQGGAGAEFALTPAISLGVEYLYSTYDLDDYEVRVGPGTATSTNPFLAVDPTGTTIRPSNKDFNVHAIRATASYHF